MSLCAGHIIQDYCVVKYIIKLFYFIAIIDIFRLKNYGLKCVSLVQCTCKNNAKELV